MRARHLDVGDLAPPEPMTRALAALDELAADEYLVLHHRREPFPLYPLLATRGFRHRCDAGRDGSFVIRIWRANGPAPAAES